jgi:phage terminase small subunit
MDDDDLSPAMRSLNEKQRRFVIAMVEYPNCTQAQAARIAGYSDVKEGAKVQGHLCAHNPSVQQAIREVAGLRLGSYSVMAAEAVARVFMDPEAEDKDILKAAGMILDRTGYGAMQTINVNKTVVDTTTKGIEERIARAMERLARLGDKPLEQIPAPVEAEFSEVKESE